MHRTFLFSEDNVRAGRIYNCNYSYNQYYTLISFKNFFQFSSSTMHVEMLYHREDQFVQLNIALIELLEFV